MAGTSPSNLRHYLGDRAGVLSAVMAELHRRGAPFLAEGAASPRGPARASLRWFLGFLVEGWRVGVGRAHAAGLGAGLDERALGEQYLLHLLEPTLAAAEARIARHVAQGEIERCDLRHAALELVCPVVLALLHQDALGGAAVRPLDLQAFLDEHVARFLRSHAPAGAT
ncbi:MAG TPA: hypothetical protein VMT17_13250 [Anaeromyxobacteraceae bacterium]|nr:hypothetical protein [Anaeromyxobacteraceae bacterium]